MASVAGNVAKVVIRVTPPVVADPPLVPEPPLDLVAPPVPLLRQTRRATLHVAVAGKPPLALEALPVSFAGAIAVARRGAS